MYYTRIIIYNSNNPKQSLKLVFTSLVHFWIFFAEVLDLVTKLEAYNPKDVADSQIKTCVTFASRTFPDKSYEIDYQRHKIVIREVRDGVRLAQVYVDSEYLDQFINAVRNVMNF